MTSAEEKKSAIVLEEDLVLKIYGFCRSKLNSVQDAEDLAQDVCLELIKAIRSGKEIRNLYAFAYEVQKHLFYNFLRKKKRSDTVYLPDVFASEENLEEAYILREQKALLRRELSMMSESYRKAVILHYFDGKTCEEIGGILGKSAGTVKWWLYDARNMIRKGMNEMKEYGEKSYRPGVLYVSCQGILGADREPVRCAARKSAQNILLAAYRKPMTVEELCQELGISAPYVEDEVSYLTENELMKKLPGDKYQTDFVILPGQDGKIGDKVYEAAFPEYYEKLMACLSAKKDLLEHGVFNRGGFSWERLLWVYIHIITQIAVEHFKYENHLHVRYADMPIRPNGGKWIGLGFDCSADLPVYDAWKDYHPYDGPVHKTDETFVQGFFHYWSVQHDSREFFDMPDAVFALGRKIIRGDKTIDALNEEEKYLFSLALEKKLFLRDGDGFRPNYYYVDRACRQKIEEIAFQFCDDVAAPIFRKVYDISMAEYAATVPAHLHGQMGNHITNSLHLLVTCSLYEAKKAGILSAPEDSEGAYWLSLFASD